MAKRALKSMKISLKRPAAQKTNKAGWTAQKQREAEKKSKMKKGAADLKKKLKEVGKVKAIQEKATQQLEENIFKLKEKLKQTDQVRARQEKATQQLDQGTQRLKEVEGLVKNYAVRAATAERAATLGRTSLKDVATELQGVYATILPAKGCVLRLGEFILEYKNPSRAAMMQELQDTMKLQEAAGQKVAKCQEAAEQKVAECQELMMKGIQEKEAAEQKVANFKWQELVRKGIQESSTSDAGIRRKCQELVMKESIGSASDAGTRPPQERPTKTK